MVTIIPGYMYSLFAALVVGTIIVSACSLSMVNIKNESASQQLSNVDQYVAAQSLIMINQVAANGQNVTQILDLPANIGNQQYWISLGNSSSSAWVESGFGGVAMQTHPQSYIPANVVASGTYVCGWGRPFLQCCVVNQTVTLILAG